MTAGFDELVDDIADLQVDVNTLRHDIEDQAAALHRIEDWLRTLGQDVVTSQFPVITNLVMNFRDQSGIDLDYATGFITGLNDFATYGETTAAPPPHIRRAGAAGPHRRQRGGAAERLACVAVAQ